MEPEKEPWQMTLWEYITYYVERAWSLELGEEIKYHQIDPTLRGPAVLTAFDNWYDSVRNAIQQNFPLPMEVSLEFYSNPFE